MQPVHNNVLSDLEFQEMIEFTKNLMKFYYEIILGYKPVKINHK